MMEWKLYTRIGCGLCEEMEHALHDYLNHSRENAFEYQKIDIDRDSGLKKRYNADVPLLVRGDEVVLQYFFDESRLTQALMHD
jgi:glutaredoxin